MLRGIEGGSGIIGRTEPSLRESPAVIAFSIPDVGDALPLKPYSRELLKGTADTLVLSTFADGEMYGYQVVKEIERRSGGFFQFKEGTLYPILHRLERQGLLIARWEAMPSGMERRYYSLTDAGREALRDRLSEWAGFAKAVARVTSGLAS